MLGLGQSLVAGCRGFKTANYGAGFCKSWNRVWIDSLFSVNRCRTGSPFPVTKPFLKRAGLILLTKIDADLAAV